MTGDPMSTGGTLPDQSSMPDDTEARALWSRLGVTGSEPEEPDALDLAAYAEGAADDAVRDRVEAFLAGRPDALDWIVAARQPAPARPFAWGRIIDRGRDLVSAPAGTMPVGGVPSWRLPRPRVEDAARWSAVAASFLLVAVLGFELGRGIDGSWADQGSRIEGPSSYGPIDGRDPLFSLSSLEEG